MATELWTRGQSGKAWKSFLALLQANPITPGLMTSGAALSVLGNATNAAATRADIVAGAIGDVLQRVGATLVFAPVSLSSIPANSLTQSDADKVSFTTAISNSALTLLYTRTAVVIIDALSTVYQIQASLILKARNKATTNRTVTVQILFGPGSSPLFTGDVVLYTGAVVIRKNSKVTQARPLAINASGKANTLPVGASNTLKVRAKGNQKGTDPANTLTASGVSIQIFSQFPRA